MASELPVFRGGLLPTPRPRRHRSLRELDISNPSSSPDQSGTSPGGSHPPHDVEKWPTDDEILEDLLLTQQTTSDIEDEDLSWNARISKLCTREEFSDVVFKVQDGDENVVSFHAHKFLLAVRSPVFRAMFYGPLAEKSGEILVPDVTPTAFKAMLIFLYKDDVVVQSLQGAWQLWYAAKKYMLDALEEKCRKHLQTHLTPLNVLDTFLYAYNYGDSQVVYQCLRLIDRKSGFIFASPGFSNLPMSLVKLLVSRSTLNIKEVDVFEGLVRWGQTEIKRRLDDEETSGQVPSLADIIKEFVPYLKLSSLTSQEFVHRVLIHGVLDIETVTEISSKIQLREEPEANREIAKFASSPEPRLGLNQACDLLAAESGMSGVVEGLRHGNVHTSDEPNRRLGPGCYQTTRFSAIHELAIVQKWPEDYTLKFKVNKSIYLLGACVTETDRQYYSPKLKYVLQLRDLDGKVISEGSETFIKKTSNKIEGGFPKVMEYGPHDVSFKNQAYIYKDKTYELNLRISNAEAPWSNFPLLVTKCWKNMTAFGVEFNFESDYNFDIKDEDEDEEDPLIYGLISRLYFFY